MRADEHCPSLRAPGGRRGRLGPAPSRDSAARRSCGSISSGRTSYELDQLADALDLDEAGRSRKARQARRSPTSGSTSKITVSAPNGSRKLASVTCLVSKRWVVTIHDDPIEMLETFRERATGSGSTGELEGLEFLANLLEWVFGSYFDAFEEIECDPGGNRRPGDVGRPREPRRRARAARRGTEGDRCAPPRV